MSTGFSIAAVTRTLLNLLEPIKNIDFDVLPPDSRLTSEIKITSHPIDRVRDTEGATPGNQVNLFLYHTEPNSALRNSAFPQSTRNGELGHSPLALNLYYVLTAYGQEDKELIAHALLGNAMRIYHDQSVLSRDSLEAALPASELHNQIERVRITPYPMGMEEVSKLWTGFQSEYRISVTYMISVVLIESIRPSRKAMPVLRRGAEDQGPLAANAAAPTLRRIKSFLNPLLPQQPAAGKPAAELGDHIILEGTHLSARSFKAKIQHSLDEQLIELDVILGTSDTEIRVPLPQKDDPGVPAQYASGFYTIYLLETVPGLPSISTNRLPFGLSPVIESMSPVTQAATAQPFTLTITCKPQIRPLQSVSLLVNSQEFSPTSTTTTSDPNTASSLTFLIEDLDPGTHVVRLRVAGVDSLPIDFSTEPLSFDSNQTLTLTP